MSQSTEEVFNQKFLWAECPSCHATEVSKPWR